MAGRKFTHKCYFRAWGVLDALGTLEGQERTLLGRPRRREERLGGCWLERAWGSHPLLPGQFPNPKPELGSLAGNRSGTGIAFQKLK